ncbi:MAG: lemA [Rhizobacter sp.]|nr:lemA [Rhizobacter sp.]
MTTTEIATAAVLALLLFWAVGAYNRLVGLRNAIGAAFMQIDAQLKRRYELIPLLVDRARSHAVIDQDETLNALMAARNQAQAAADHARVRRNNAGLMTSLAMAETLLADTLARTQAMVASRTELSDDLALRELSDELAASDQKASFTRQLYNDAALEFNAAARQFPTNIIARFSGFRQAALLQP